MFDTNYSSQLGEFRMSWIANFNLTANGSWRLIVKNCLGLLDLIKQYKAMCELSQIS